MNIVKPKILQLRYFILMDADFKINLRSELDYLGLTVKELSAKAGIPQGTLNGYLGARASMPPADIAVKIAKALNVTVEYLITGQETKKQEKLPNHKLRSVNQDIRSINRILVELGDKDIETILGLAKVLKNK